MKLLKFSRGFTLIELLVVIVILAILAAIALTSFNSAQKSARDSTRRSDLEQYRIALQSYAANNNGKFPRATTLSTNVRVDNSCGTATGIFAATGATSLVASGYLPAMIPDPKQGSDCLTQIDGNSARRATYRYITNDSTGDSSVYNLQVDLENGGVWQVCSTGQSGKANCTASWDTPSGPCMNDTICDVQ